MRKPVTKEAALLRMADLCARAEHCSAEITEKLRKMMLPASDVRAVVAYLEENRYLDNARFARAYANDKVRFSGWGRYKIRMGLLAKRISSSDIREALDSIDEKEYADALLRAAQAKSRSLDLNDYDDRTKLYRHLASRGFESALISKTISHLKNKE